MNNSKYTDAERAEVARLMLLSHEIGMVLEELEAYPDNKDLMKYFFEIQTEYLLSRAEYEMRKEGISIPPEEYILNISQNGEIIFKYPRPTFA